MQFADSIILVTGASTGVGRAIAVEAARRGARAVVMSYHRNGAAAVETAKEVEALGSVAMPIQGDVGSDADCRSIVDTVARYGRLTCLFNNAGSTKFAAHADLDAVNADDFESIYRTNVLGAFQMIRAARSLLEKDPRAAVVNTSSIAGVTGVGSSVPYACSKGALNTLTLSLARALAPKIRVNAVCPGFVDTPWFDKGLPPTAARDLKERARTAAPLQSVSEAEDVARTALFLASWDARHITGETLLVDCGVHLGR